MNASTIHALVIGGAMIGFVVLVALGHSDDAKYLLAGAFAYAGGAAAQKVGQ